MKLNRGTFFLWFFNSYCMIYGNASGIRDPLKQDLRFAFCWKKNKDISILTENHINHDQIHHIRNHWLAWNIFSLGDSLTNGCLSCFIWDLEVDTDPKGWFVSFKFTPYNELSVFMLFHGIGNSWIGSVSL